MSALRAEAVTVRFGGLTAVDGVTLEVPAGGRAGLIGPNGAGKTTLFDAVCGFIVPAQGRISVGGTDVTHATVSQRARLGIGRTFQKLELFGRMSVAENLMVAAEAGASRLGLLADLLRLPQRAREEARCRDIAAGLLALLGLEEVAHRRAADLPVGIARRLELARALCAAPSVLLLDEPSSGLDSAETEELGALLRRINDEQGVAILLVEHDMDLVMSVCEEITVLEFGRLVARGTPAEIVADPAVRAAYLGGGGDANAASAPRR